MSVEKVFMKMIIYQEPLIISNESAFENIQIVHF